MKNVFSLGLLAVATALIAFSSCKPANEVKAVTGITLSETSKKLTVGEAFALTATVEPADATDKNIVWTSENTEIATVDDGNVIGVASGTTEIKATTRDGGKTATCTVTVVREPTRGNALLFEDFTATWCGPCFKGMENIQKQIASFGNKVILVCHHTGDDFAIEHSEDLSKFYEVTGIPASMLDRTKGIYGNGVTFHPGYLTKEVLTQKLAEPKTVKISLETSYDESSREIKIKVSGSLEQSHPKAKLNVYLVQDGIKYEQNGSDGNYIHHNALRAVISKGLWGDDLGVTQGAYSKEYTYNLPQKIGNFATKPNKMYIVAFVAEAANTSGDNTKNIVHNAAIQSIK
jgi:phage major tail protein, phi13 family